MYKLRFSHSDLKQEITSSEYYNLSWEDKIKYEEVIERTIADNIVDIGIGLSLISDVFDSSNDNSSSSDSSFDGFGGGDFGGGGASSDW